MCAAEGDQLKDPVITVLLSITANLWWSSLRCASQIVFSGVLRHLKLESRPLSLIELFEVG